MDLLFGGQFIVAINHPGGKWRINVTWTCELFYEYSALYFQFRLVCVWVCDSIINHAWEKYSSFAAYTLPIYYTCLNKRATSIREIAGLVIGRFLGQGLFQKVKVR
ncbi:hypothetical protein CHS0354_041704 [Potamilus streckersoni]|uniref:Uncharacterized protein n=1 Tax=Potamilus streckersoni TaxID=2493646 RepID=A0AAE0T144_9BIVA|nr:hypothetical protein CHS0354_041704 [Potamilus streckersoni]